MGFANASTSGVGGLLHTTPYEGDVVVGPGFLAATHWSPFCWAADVYCSADSQSPVPQRYEQSRCRRLPRFPDDCGVPGKPCCPTGDRLTSDKYDMLPLRGQPCSGGYCANGTFCGGAFCDYNVTAGATPMCKANAPTCGRAGQPCCRWDTGNGMALFRCVGGACVSVRASA